MTRPEAFIRGALRMTPQLVSRLASSAAFLTIAAAPVASQSPAADSAAEFKLAASWTPARTSTVAPLRRAIALNLEGASVKQALREIGRLSGIDVAYGDDVLHSDVRVWVHADGMTVREALAAVLEGTGLDAFVSLSGKAVLVRAIALGDSTQAGSVAGRVTDAKTGQGIPGASVSLDGTRWRAMSDENGTYRLIEVTPGSYTLTANRIGYTRQSQSVTVTAGQEATLDVRLEVSASPLDAVVVTGTMVPTEVKALPTPISVITAEDIQQQNLQRVDQVFRGQVPGAIAWDVGPYDYFSRVAVRGASTLGTPTVKTFIDGVEVADPQYIATIDPASVERIEITRGPQASTLYGAGALDGVLQIFTKKGQLGLTRPQVTVKTSAGGVGGFDGQSTAFQTDNAASVLGGDEKTAYNLSGSYRRVGDWVPSYRSINWNASAGFQTTQGAFTLSGSARYSDKRWEDPWDTRFQSYSFFSKPSYYTMDLPQQTYGVTAGWQATPHWQHVLTVGYDQTNWVYRQTQPRFTTPADSLLTAYNARTAKTSLLYHMDLSFPVGSTVAATVTAGVNHDSYDFVDAYTYGATRTTGSLDGSTFASHTPWTTTGYFGQVQFGIAERLFLTSGVRAEQNQNFGADFGTAWSPRVGAAYVLGLGPTTLKIRASYGESIRAPDPSQRQALRFATYQYLANPGLGPERQRGGDGGIELYFGQRVSLGATYYNQRAINLIQVVQLPDSFPTYQYQNLARVKNEGWEFEGRAHLGLVQVAGTYSVTNSTIQQLPAGYPSGNFQVGDRLLGIPYTSAGAAVTYSPLAGTSATVSMTLLGHWTNTDYLALYGYYFGGQPYRGSQRAYWIEYPTVAKFAVSMRQELRKGLEAFLRVDNAGNNLRYEQFNYNVPMPRSVTVGATFRY
jgi:outer membrane receptor protein involved in Fe transport